MKKLKKLAKKLTIFDWLIVFVIIGGLVFFASFIFKKEQWIKVELKVGLENLQWGYQPSPYWLADSIKKGESQFDGLGGKEAEVLGTEIYEWGGGKKSIYLLLNLKVNYNKQKRVYRFTHQAVEIGRPLKLEMGNVGFEGIVMSIEGKALGEKVVKVVEAKLLDVYPWTAEAIVLGAEMKDDKGQLVAQVLEKKIQLADITVTTDRGDVLARKDPLKRDVILKLELVTTKRNQSYYFREEQNIKIGNGLWIKLPQVDISGASIINILE